MVARLRVARRRHALLERQGLQRMIPGAEIGRRLARRTPRFGAMNLRLDAGHDPFGNLFLYYEDVCYLAVVTLGEQVVASRPFDELHGDANPLAGAPRAALDKIGRAQFAADLGGVLRLALVGERRVARHDWEPAPIGKRRN